MREEVYIGALISNEYLTHHGIKGQKWGNKNGPPYPIDDSDHSASEKKAGWKKSLVKSNQRKVSTENMAKHNATGRFRRWVRAHYNGALGQRWMVNADKGYKQDKKKLKNEYRSNVKSLNKEDSNFKQKKQKLKDAYKRENIKARVKAADSIYGKQSHALNKTLQSQSVGKAFARSLLLGDYGALKYTEQRVDKSASIGKAAVIGLLHTQANFYSINALSVVDSYARSQTRVSKNDRTQVKQYRKAQKKR